MSVQVCFSFAVFVDHLSESKSAHSVIHVVRILTYSRLKCEGRDLKETFFFHSWVNKRKKLSNSPCMSSRFLLQSIGFNCGEIPLLDWQSFFLTSFFQ
jgi:hypothetical protein